MIFQQNSSFISLKSHDAIKTCFLDSQNEHTSNGDGGGEQGADGGVVNVVPGPKKVVTLKKTRDCTFSITIKTLFQLQHY